MHKRPTKRDLHVEIFGLACLMVCFLTPAVHGETGKQAESAMSAVQIPAIRHYIEWRGGGAFESLSSVHLSGHVVDGGLEGTKEFWETSRGEYWEREKAGSIVTAVAVSEHGHWRTNLSGQPITLSVDEIRRYQRQSALLFPGIFRGDLGATVQPRPDETFDGSSWNVFRVSFGDADSYDFFVDTGKLGALRATVDRRSSFTVYSDWKVVAGIQHPFRRELRSANLASQNSFDARTIEFNRPPPASLFDRPRDPVQLVFRSALDWSGWIKFDFVDGKRIFIPAEVNGRRTTMLLDSGAETTILGNEIAQRVGVDCSGRIGVEGAGGSDAAALCTGVSIRLGEASISGVTASRMDLEAVGRNVGVSIAAILGQEIFNSAIVDIDFGAKRIAFRAPAHFRIPKEARRLALKPWAGNRILEVSVEGRPSIPVLFDLGNGSALDLFPSYWKPLRMLDGRPFETSQMGGSGGTKPVSVATVDPLVFGGVVFHSVRTNFTAEADTTENSVAVKGNLGTPVLDHFHLMTDYARDEMYVIPLEAGDVTFKSR